MKRRGSTLVEVMTATVLVSMLIISALALLSTSLRSFNKTDKRIEMSDEGAIALRKISEELRSAVVVDILSSGREVAFELPLRNTHVDPVTGEYEYATPVVTDGIDRRYYVSSDGDLMYKVGTSAPRRIMAGVMDLDPDPESAHYNQPYPVFSLEKLSNRQSLRITVIAERETVSGTQRNRMSTEALLRNVQ